MKDAFLIVGLGNPSPDYDNTPHNFGRAAVEFWLKEKGAQEEESETNFLRAPHFSGKAIRSNDGTIIVPDLGTYMNESGSSVRTLLQFFKIETQNLVLVHDELALSFGTLRISYDISGAGHNGVQSVIDTVGSQQFIRFRLGAESRLDHQIPSEHFVLQKLSPDQHIVAKQLFQKTSQALTKLIADGREAAMNEFNSKP